MNSESVAVFCEIDQSSQAPDLKEEAQSILGHELDAIRRELGHELDFSLAVGHAPLRARTQQRPPDTPRIRLYVDGAPLNWSPLEQDANTTLRALLRAQVPALLTPRAADHLWSIAGGTGVSPLAYRRLIQQLARYGLRPNRAADAVEQWPHLDALRLFEAALADASRKILVRVHPGRVAELSPAFDAGAESAVMKMTDALFYELGVICGECELVADAQVEAGTLRVQINDLSSPPIPLPPLGRTVVNDTVDRLALLNIQGTAWVNPANGNDCALIADDFVPAALDAGLTIWSPSEWTTLIVSSQVKARAHTVLSLDAMQFQLDKLATAFPYLVRHVEQTVGMERFARVLRYLLREELSIRSLRTVIDALATSGPTHTESMDLSAMIVFAGTYTAIGRSIPIFSPSVDDPIAAEDGELVRSGMRRYISHKHTRGQSTLIVYLLDAAIERRLMTPRPLSHRERRQLLHAVNMEVGSLPRSAHRPCLLTTADIRWRLKDELLPGYHQLAVLSYQELSPEMNIQPIAKISLSDTEPDPAEAVDDALSALQHEEATDLLATAVQAAPPSWVTTQLAELLFFWNEIGDASRLRTVLDSWLALPALSDPARADIEALREQPDPSAIREWLRARDPLGFQRLQGDYVPSPADLVRINGGRFSMGHANGNASPVHDVVIDSFDIAPTPVTARQFSFYLRTTGLPWSSTGLHALDPARGVTWKDAVAYCSWLSDRCGLERVYSGEAPVVGNHARGGFRLPTEAEWEFAARGGTASQDFVFAGSDRLSEVGDVSGLDPVALRLPNEISLYDMSGGRAEWCWDWYASDYYSQSPVENPVGPSAGLGRVCRGADPSALEGSLCTVFARQQGTDDEAAARAGNYGFRLARSRSA
jgi:formylglycine-generating enzyme required for sulfatase activity